MYLYTIYHNISYYRWMCSYMLLCPSERMFKKGKETCSIAFCFVTWFAFVQVSALSLQLYELAATTYTALLLQLKYSSNGSPDSSIYVSMHVVSNSAGILMNVRFSRKKKVRNKMKIRKNHIYRYIFLFIYTVIFMLKRMNRAKHKALVWSMCTLFTIYTHILSYINSIVWTDKGTCLAYCDTANWCASVCVAVLYNWVPWIASPLKWNIYTQKRNTYIFTKFLIFCAVLFFLLWIRILPLSLYTATDTSAIYPLSWSLPSAIFCRRKYEHIYILQSAISSPSLQSSLFSVDFLIVS